MNLARLVRMTPAEVATRARQAFNKRYAKPPALRLVPSTAQPRFPDPPPPQEVPNFGTPIDWHFDPVHNKRAPRIPWYQIPFLDFDQIGDHKIIWEPNRHQHLVALAQAGRRDEVIAQWTDWQRENPYPIGINWASTLEVAFRALSWLWLRHLLGDFHPDLLAALHLHGWYIEHFLSTYYSPNTHLLGEGIALFAIGLMCPQIAESARWQKRGWRIVIDQAAAQVRPDGFHFEQSVYYHRYALDFFQFARDLAALNGIPVPFEETLEKMRPAANLPNFGDDDGGRVIVSPHASPPPPPTIGGIYTMRSGDAELFIDAGPQGAFSAGHGHADALSIQLRINGHPVLIDPGTYCYVCPERDRFRGTAAHNTLQVDGRDQATPAGPFAWTHLPQVTVDRWQTTDTYDLLTAHHTGYKPVIHHRTVLHMKSKFWFVRDVVTGPGRHRLDIHWHYLNEQDVTILAPAGHTWTRTVERWDWSPVYGRKEPACVLRFSTETNLPAEFAVLLLTGEPGSFTQTAPGAYHYEGPQGVHELTL